MRTEELDAVVRELDLYGIRSTVEHRSKHLEVCWEHEGRKGSQIVPTSGSDVRGRLNARGDVRRWLRMNGVTMPTGRPAAVVLQKALSLPLARDEGPARLTALEQNLDALLDMVADLSAEKLELQSKFQSLTARISNMKIVSHVIFGEEETQAPAPVLEVIKHPPEQKAANVVSLVPQYAGYAGPPGGSARVLEALKDGRWRSRTELASVLGVTPTRASQTLNYLREHKKVENGARGMWRKVISVQEVIANQEAPTLLGAALKEALQRQEAHGS